MTDLWNNSRFSTLRSCEQKFVYRYVEGLNTPTNPTDEKLLLGSWFHALMYAHGLRQGMVQESLLHPVPDTMNLGFDFIDPMPVPTEYDGTLVTQVQDYLTSQFLAKVGGMSPDLDAIPERAWFLFDRYVARWFTQGSLLTDKVLAVEYEWQRTDEASGITYVGKIDKIILREDGLLILRDYKTTGQKPTTDFRLTNSQLHLYAWGVAPFLDMHGLSVDAVEYDYAITREPRVRLTKAGALYKNQSVMDYRALEYLLSEELRASDHDHAYDDERFADHYEAAREEGDEKFFSRNLLPINETVIIRLLDEQVQLVDRATRLDNGSALPIAAPGRACGWCEYSDLCVAEMYGNDATPIREFYQIVSDT